MDRKLEQEAVLVTFASSQWPGVVGDQRGRQAISEKYGNEPKAMKPTEKYLVDPEEISKNMATFAAARTWYYEQTLPWEKRRGGARLLPGTNYQTFKEGMDRLINAVWERVDEFCISYPQLKAEWVPKLNGLHQAKDYPSVDAIRGQFNLTVTYSPLPLSPASLTLKFLGQAEFEALRETIAGQFQEQGDLATGDLYKRLFEAVKRMAERLSDPEAIFRDTLVGNLTEITDLIPRLNFNQDRELDALAVQVKADLADLDPEILRTDLKTRKRTASQAGKLMETIAGAAGRFIDLS
jgi:hypothetical protein